MQMLKISAEELKIGELSAVKVNGAELFDINKIFDCGQSFRFDRVENSIHEIEFAGVAYGKYVSFAADGDTLYIYNSTLDEYEKIWKNYLSLDTDYNEINSSILSLSGNKNLADAMELSSGIRILKQETWEALCSFIISQNNNIPRIKKLVAALCEATDNGSDLTKNMDGHIASAHLVSRGNFAPFPTPDKVLSLGVEGLKNLKMGFRAKYIFDAAKKVSEGEINLYAIRDLATTKEASDELCKISGVGPKVAACTLLFGFHRLDAFPVDVWIKRVIEKYFDESFTPDNLGKFAGVAQQYLFYYERYTGGDKNG